MPVRALLYETDIMELVQTIVRRWPFARAMAAREMKGLTKGSVFGSAWLAIRPFIQVAA